MFQRFNSAFRLVFNLSTSFPPEWYGQSETDFQLATDDKVYSQILKYLLAQISYFLRHCIAILLSDPKPPYVRWSSATNLAVSFNYAATILGALGLFAKHVLHSTGLPCVGLNGTVVSLPHAEQVTCVSVRRRPSTPCLLALHCLQCFGSLVNPFSWKNCCSPAENTNITPQPAHRTSRSAKGIIPLPSTADSEKGTGGSRPSVKTGCVSGSLYP
jgi:hypothetical protein